MRFNLSPLAFSLRGFVSDKGICSLLFTNEPIPVSVWLCFVQSLQAERPWLLIREFNQAVVIGSLSARTLRHERQPEENILRAPTMLFPSFSYYSSLMERRPPAM